MEIERKWMVSAWPQGLKLLAEYEMEQGYLSVRPTVRIRKESRMGGETEYILCFKGKGRLSRQELELPLEEDFYHGLEEIIAKPLIPKLVSCGIANCRWDQIDWLSPVQIVEYFCVPA